MLKSKKYIMQLFLSFQIGQFSKEEMAEDVIHLNVNHNMPRRRNLPMLLVEGQDNEVIEETFFVFPSSPFLGAAHCSTAVPPLVVVGEKGRLRAASHSSLPPPSPFLGPQNR